MLHSHSVLYEIDPPNFVCENLGELSQNAGEIARCTLFHLKVGATKRQLLPAALLDTKLVYNKTRSHWLCVEFTLKKSHPNVYEYITIVPGDGSVYKLASCCTLFRHRSTA